MVVDVVVTKVVEVEASAAAMNYRCTYCSAAPDKKNYNFDDRCRGLLQQNRKSVNKRECQHQH
jgi:hypothetical protein